MIMKGGPLYTKLMNANYCVDIFTVNISYLLQCKNEHEEDIEHLLLHFSRGPIPTLISFKEARYSRSHLGISLQLNGFPILAVLEVHFMVKSSNHKSNFLSAGLANVHYVNGTQRANFLSIGGWNFYHMVQAAQEKAQKSQNILYHVSLKRERV